MKDMERFPVEAILVMRECLQKKPKDRPLFAELDRRLGGMSPSAFQSPAFSLKDSDIEAESDIEGYHESERIEDKFEALNGDSHVIMKSLGRKKGNAGPRSRKRSRSESKLLVHSLFPEHIADALMRGER